MSWQVFNRLYEKYDDWFESLPGQKIFELEARCIKDILKETPRPYLEVGVGTGRFAEKLGVDFGVDPSFNMLNKALERKVKVAQAPGEMLPFPSHSFGTVALIVTLCFLDNPVEALKESSRVLGKNGVLILGIVPKDSHWGRFYLKKRKEGHPFYSVAHFYTPREATDIAEKAGFKLGDIYSTLFESPSECERIRHYPAKPKLAENAGFVCIKMRKP